MELRESTVATITMGPALDKTDGVTPESALTPAVRLKKNGAAAVARSSATAITHDENGYYNVEVNTTDTNTRGRLRAMFTDAATHVPVWEDFDVLAAAYYDEKYGGPLALTDGGASTATLDAGASAVDGFYVGQLITLTSGTGAGQTRRGIGYVGATKVLTVDLPWVTNPIAGTTYRLLASASSMLSVIERDAVADAYLLRVNGIEAGLNPRDAARLAAAGAAAKLSGATAGASTVVLRNALADTKDRITATCDAFGNRTAVTLDLT